ncbi:hypothetical protein AXG93_17s1110 [Marchantia polymorpha subsp. ruderalis]|uniref:Rhodopsin n=1 Tax=Marchantia polymorpha subsp. ruderalis TaxID=1480154 RepID=A0A176VI67_MARPO|nr:hypothetical protein AXG93_17s1110 [Marchantia polymorpha subsp. ruderalis]
MACGEGLNCPELSQKQGTMAGRWQPRGGSESGGLKDETDSACVMMQRVFRRVRTTHPAREGPRATGRALSPRILPRSSRPDPRLRPALYKYATRRVLSQLLDWNLKWNFDEPTGIDERNGSLKFGTEELEDRLAIEDLDRRVSDKGMGSHGHGFPGYPPGGYPGAPPYGAPPQGYPPYGAPPPQGYPPPPQGYYAPPQGGYPPPATGYPAPSGYPQAGHPPHGSYPAPYPAPYPSSHGGHAPSGYPVAPYGIMPMMGGHGGHKAGKVHVGSHGHSSHGHYKHGKHKKYKGHKFGKKYKGGYKGKGWKGKKKCLDAAPGNLGW